jgi:hypothetical protein
MNFDLEQALDFVEKRNSKRSMEYYENRKKKRKIYSEQASNDNELPDIISSFPHNIDLKSKVTTNIENNCLLIKQTEENTGYSKIIAPPPPYMYVQKCLFYFNNERY